MTQPSSPSPRLPPSPQLAELLARLRAEQAAGTPEAKPLLSHELGVAQEAVDEGGATRDFLAAFNTDPRFREPLEALLRLFARRSSTKNLGRLLDALIRAAETPEEQARAHVERGAFLLDQGQDEEGARASFEAAIAASPDEAAAWLELEILAAKRGDAEARARALEARSSLTKDPSWRGLLLIDRAEMESRLGRIDPAIEWLEAACELSGIARYPAFRALEGLARREALGTRLVEALEAQAELAAEAMADADRGDALGVPRNVRNASSVADFFWRAAEARRRLGDAQGAASSIDRALAVLPADSRLLWARLAAAEACGEAEKASELARALLEGGASASSGASLWLRLAEGALEADPSLSLEAAQKALEWDPGCIPARELRLELLEKGGEAEALAMALESDSEALQDEASRARAHLLAAFVHAREGRDASSAKAALAQAASFGASPSVLARAGRLFANLLGEGPWLDEATLRLATTTEVEAEPASLWFELARRKLLQRDAPAAHKALAALVTSPGGRWLGGLLLAYTQPIAEDGSSRPWPESLEALDALIAREDDPERARALTLAAAARAHALGQTEGAEARLRALSEANPADEVAAIYLADLARCSGRPDGAARVLARASAETTDPELASSLRFEAFALAYRSGDFEAALSALGDSEASEGVLAWALRGISPDEAAGRMRALDGAAAGGDDPAAVALERFGLLKLEGTDDDDARLALDAVESRGSGALLEAWSLAHIVSPPIEDDVRERALDRLGSLSSQGRALVAFERLRTARLEGDPIAAELAAREWAEAEGTLASALEWLGTTFRLDHRDAEVLARKRVATALAGEERSAMEASAAAVTLARAPSGSHPLLGSTDVSSALMNLELARLGCDPRRRAHALTELGGALGSDTRVDALLLAGENHLAAGNAAAALVAFQKVTEARPDEIWGWEGVRAAAEVLEDPRSFAIACAHLGELCQDDARGAEFWERAGLLLLDRLNEPRQAELALEQAFTRDPKRGVAFDRLFRQIRGAGNHDKLLSLVARRLEVADDSAELAKLFWEQARALRQQGNREGALAALESVTAIEPDHVGALALSGEIFITQGQYAQAAQALARLSTLPEAPDRQRLMSGVAAVDLYENKLGDSIRALEVLVGLHEAGLSNLPVRERLARAAAKTESWRHAASIFEELMNDRPTREGRIEAARLAMALWRDKLDSPARAERATTKLLAEAPGDGEGIDVVLTSPFDPAVRRSLLESSRDHLVRAIAAQPSDADGIARLSAIARSLGNLPLRQAALGALVAVGRAEAGADAELAELDQRVRSTPQVAIDEATIARIADPEDTGPIARLFQALSEPLGEALGPSLAAMGVGKKDRIDPRAGFPVRNEISAWAGALGLDEVSVYIGGPDPEGVQGIPGEAPAIVIGTAIRAPLSPRQRQAVARELFALQRGSIVSRTRDETTIAALVVAACNLAEIPIDSPPYAVLADLQRQLAKTLSRKTKKLLPELCRDIVSSSQDPKRWARAAQVSMHRMAAIAAGDVSFVLADLLDQPRRQLASSVGRDERAQRLIAFVLSPQYLELRERLGMGIQ